MTGVGINPADEGGEAPCYAHMFEEADSASDVRTTPPSPSIGMETMTDAIARLRTIGYEVDFAATTDGQLVCLECGAVYDPGVIDIDHTVRFEGDSNPDDEAILLALRGADGCRGLFSAAFGPSASAQDAEVLVLLARRAG